jgi:hypothetical protein
MSATVIASLAGAALRESLRGPLPTILLVAALLVSALLASAPSTGSIEDAQLVVSLCLNAARAVTVLGCALLVAGGFARAQSDGSLRPLLATRASRSGLVIARGLAGFGVAATLASSSHALAAIAIAQIDTRGLEASGIAHPDHVLEATRLERSEAIDNEPTGWLRGGGGRSARWTIEREATNTKAYELNLRLRVEGYVTAAGPDGTVRRHADFTPCRLSYVGYDAAGQVVARRQRLAMAGLSYLDRDTLPASFVPARSLTIELAPATPSGYIRASRSSLLLVTPGIGSLGDNLFRSAALSGIAGLLVASIGVLSATMFPAPLAIAFCLALYIGGIARPSIAVLVSSTQGAVASLGAARPELGARGPSASSGPGPFVRAYLSGILRLLPKLDELDSEALVRQGELLSWQRHLRALQSSGSYSLIALALACLLFRQKELHA